MGGGCQEGDRMEDASRTEGLFQYPTNYLKLFLEKGIGHIIWVERDKNQITNAGPERRGMIREPGLDTSLGSCGFMILLPPRSLGPASSIKILIYLLPTSY